MCPQVRYVLGDERVVDMWNVGAVIVASDLVVLHRFSELIGGRIGAAARVARGAVGVQERKNRAAPLVVRQTS
jgi:hypothetical protein